MKTFLATLLFAGLSSAALAQDSGQGDTALAVKRVEDAPRFALPANTEVLLSMNQDVTTKGRTWNEGDTFNLSVVHDVMYEGYMVIPRGSRAVGRITWLTSKGAFGKSGKMDVSLEYIEVRGQRVPISGTYRQEGEGNTVATVGGVIVAGVFAGFVTGRSALIPRGRELVAHTENDIPLAVSVPAAPVAPIATLAAQPLAEPSVVETSH